MKFGSLPTEASRARFTSLDAGPSAVRALARAAADAALAVGRAAPALDAAARLMASAVREGRRVVYFGAGTSGRLAVMEAAELWPTFSVRASAVIAGGRRALLRAVEGAEDDPRAGARAASFLRKGDLAVGITASGITPWVAGVLRRATANGAGTVLVTCNPRPTARAHVVIVLRTGPEPLTGSTRMNAGTATKIALNTMSTCAMALLGKTWKNRMVDVVATNAKLRDRARRLVVELGKVTPAAAARLLRATASAKEAIAMARLKCGVVEARRRLREAGGHLARALS